MVGAKIRKPAYGRFDPRGGNVFAAVSLGVALGPHKGVLAPASITVDGKPFSLQEGKIYIFFFDPSCCTVWKPRVKWPR